MKASKNQGGSTLLGLSLDGNRLEGIVLRRTNGSVKVQKTFFASLSLDPLTNDAELVGQEIRNRLIEAGIGERRCVISVPLSWALTLHTKVPELPEADVSSFLQIEAERGFPYGPDALLISNSRFRSPAGETYATQVAVPRDNILRLEKALKAARLKPVSFSLGIAALQSADKKSSDGVLALAIGENSIGVQISCGGGLAALRTLEGSLENEGGKKLIHTDVVARELRITLGQLPAEMRDTVRQVRVFGDTGLGQQLIEELRQRVEPTGIKVERVTAYAPDEFGVKLPADAEVSPAFSLAARHLTGKGALLEFLPPKITTWQQFNARYSSAKLVWAGTTAGAVALVIAGAFLAQQWQLSRLRSQWKVMSPKVTELEGMQQNIRKFRPWFDESLRSLSILKRLTEAFPEDGAVSAKTVEIRDLAVICTGTARDSQSLIRMRDKLSAAPGVTDIHIEQTRGKSPLQFTFNFHWNERGSHER
jgi:hypothetical protein